MRPALAILLAFMPNLASAANEPISSMSKEELERLIKSGEEAESTSAISYEDEERLINNLIKHPPHLSAARLPPGYKIGRCLLVVEGKTRISGKCAYRVNKGGDFVIEGPRQIYDGFDYPSAHGSIALMISTDYWANVFREEDGTWDGYGNPDIRYVKAEGPNFGPLRRDGACLLNQRVRVCLWKS